MSLEVGAAMPARSNASILTSSTGCCLNLRTLVRVMIFCITAVAEASPFTASLIAQVEIDVIALLWFEGSIF